MKIKTLFGILTITASFALQAGAQSYLTNGLVAYYPFNGNAFDASGSGHTGTLLGTVAYGVDRFGNSNSCIALPGTAGTGSCVDIPSLFSMPYLPVTYSAWFWLSNFPPLGDNVMTLLGREQCGSQSDGAISIFSQPETGVTNKMIYFIGSGGYFPQTGPPTNQWCQVVVTVDQSGNAKFYFNGTNSPGSGPASAGQPQDFRIGASASGGCGGSGRYVWNGRIDDVRIYNRVLSSNEVQQLYNYESTSSEPCIPHPATAVATVTNGFVVMATLTDGGCGYTNAPLVAIVGGGGTGATAVAMVNNGVVTNIMVTDTGHGYTSTPTIVIGGPPSITAQPQSVTVNANAPASFSVAAVGTPSLNYQWSVNSTNIPGATSSTLTISNVVQTNLGTYAVVVSNPFGSTNSSGALLGMYPFLIAPFMGVDTYWGQTNTLSVGAWGTGPLTYQWYQNGVALQGATDQTLALGAIQFTNAGLYTVVVSNSFGSVTNTPYQVVVNPANIALQICPNVVIQGTVGYSYIIQSTTNLADTNSWVTETNLTLTQPIQYWDDTNIDVTLPNNPKKFYKVLPGQ